jgi:PEP-CTERM motif
MKQVIAGAVTAAALLLAATPSQAITIGFQPTAQVVTAGSSVGVAVVISDLGSGAAPSLSAFDLDVTFDETILSFVSAAFGDPMQGNQLDLGGFGTVSGVTPGVGAVGLFELSLDTPADLEVLQAGSFILATLTFNATSGGVNPLGILITDLGDAFGDALTADVLTGSITVTGTAVPEPGSLLLLMIGAAGFAAARGDRRIKRTR